MLHVLDLDKSEREISPSRRPKPLEPCGGKTTKAEEGSRIAGLYVYPSTFLEKRFQTVPIYGRENSGGL